MIQYSLKCDQDHSFDSWFQSAAAFDKLLKAKMVTCAICGTSSVQKAIMAPRVNKSGVPSEPDEKPQKNPLSAPPDPAQQALKELRKHIETNADYVGDNFAAEARAMHDGSAPERSIYGAAKPDEAKQLLKEGIPVAPLPFMPGRKTN
ncbi:MAG: DUF1178 family protein [Marinovum sp.]|jgi:hypothetical protein|nr:DUF1178 family protein [Marinovum sp.]